MAVKLNSTGGGSVTLDSPSTASNYTVTLPSAAGTLATTTGTGSVFTNPTINGFTGDTSAITIGTTQFVKDTSGNVGIGTGTPESNGSTYTTLSLNNATNGGVLSFLKNGVRQGLIFNTSTGGLAIEADTAGGAGSIIQFYTNGASERARIDSSGNLGLGVTPSAWGTGYTPIQGLGYSLYSGNSGNVRLSANEYINSGGSSIYRNNGAASLYAQAGAAHAWYTAPSGTAGNPISGANAFVQTMTLDASGNLVLGDTAGIGARQSVIVNGNTGIGYFRNTATSGLSSDQLQVAVGQAAGTGFFLTRMYTSVTTTPVVGFSVRGDGVIFSNYLAGGATTLSVDASANIIRTPSDRNLKTNDKALSYGLAEVNKMRPIIHEWTPEANMGDGKSIGFIAQEMEEIIPEVVSGNESKSLDYGKLTAVLTAAIKELSAQNNALEARLAKLEAK